MQNSVVLISALQQQHAVLISAVHAVLISAVLCASNVYVRTCAQHMHSTVQPHSAAFYLKKAGNYETLITK